MKEKGLTINGVKKILNNTETSSLDEDTDLGLYKPNLDKADVIKNKVKKISRIVKDLKEFK